MNDVDKERHGAITQALSGIGVETFLVIGLRHRDGQSQDEREAFYAIDAGDRTLLVGALKSVFLSNLDLTEMVIEIIVPIVKELKKKMALGVDQQGGAA